MLEATDASQRWLVSLWSIDYLPHRAPHRHAFPLSYSERRQVHFLAVDK